MEFIGSDYRLNADMRQRIDHAYRARWSPVLTNHLRSVIFSPRGFSPRVISPLMRLLDDWLPRHCALCDARLSGSASPGLCPGCLAALPGRDAQRCRDCARRLPLARPLKVSIDRLSQVRERHNTCEACEQLTSDPDLDSVHAACDYAPPLDRWITAMKYGGDPALAAPLGELLIPQGAALASRVDQIIAIPPSAKRLVERGFDHTAQLAAPVARALGLQLQVRFKPRPLARVRHTPEQAGLDQQARRRNLQGAFVAHSSVVGKSVLLIDDVMTTGSTLREAARALREKGARSVMALVVARAHSIR
jgi:ComF family protein